MRLLIFSLMLAGCAGAWVPPDGFVRRDVPAGEYEIATYGRLTDKNAPVHIYIEGDGRAFNAHGEPTTDPTPRGKMMRNLAARDTSPNVVYMARPCQFIMSATCDTTDWTDGRFSSAIVDTMAQAIKTISGTRPVVLIGYSGGGLLSGIVINRHPEIRVKKWITIAGVPNHAAWTGYFDDSPLTKSLDLEKKPPAPAVHYVGTRDTVVPPELARKFFPASQIIEIPNAGHNDFEKLNLDFD